MTEMQSSAGHSRTSLVIDSMNLITKPKEGNKKHFLKHFDYPQMKRSSTRLPNQQESP